MKEMDIYADYKVWERDLYQRVWGGGLGSVNDAATNISHPEPIALSSPFSHCILVTWDACHFTASGLAHAYLPWEKLWICFASAFFALLHT